MINDRDKEDAERYRWLRQQHWSESSIACVVNPKIAVKLGEFCPYMDLLDQFIDEAREKERK